MVVVMPTSRSDQNQEPAPFDWKAAKGGKVLCLRCHTQVHDIHRHWEGKSRNCELIQSRRLVVAEQCLAALRRMRPAAPYTQLVNTFNFAHGGNHIATLKVVSRYDRLLANNGRPRKITDIGSRLAQDSDVVRIGKSLFKRTETIWIDWWIWDVLNIKVVSPVFKTSILRRLLVDEEAWFGWHDPDFQAAIQSIMMLSGKAGPIKDLIQNQPWWRRLL